MSKKLNIQEHFVVPEGYFENLTERMMEKLPEQPFQPMFAYDYKVVRVHSLIRLARKYAAAVAVVLVAVAFSALTALYASKTDAEIAEAESPDVMLNDIDDDASADYVVDQFNEYAMYDHQDIYEMLIEE